MAKAKSVTPIIGTGRSPETRLTVQKSNPLFGLWRSELTLAEFKIIDTYLSRIDSHDPVKRSIRLEKGEIERLLGVSKINRPELQERLKHLGTMVSVDDPTKSKSFRMIALFECAECEQDEDDIWQITLTCTEAAMKYIFNIERLGYIRYKLNAITSLRSRYSYIIFQYLEKNRHIHLSWQIKIEELRVILKADEPLYQKFKYFNDKILKPSQKEIIEKTNCRYAYEPIKKGRRVVAIKFTLFALPKEYEAPEQLEMPGFTDSEPVFDVSQSEAERRDLYRDALAPYVVTDDQIDELVHLARKHIDARGHFTGSDLDQQIYNYLLSAKRHATTNSRSEIKNIYRYLLPIIKSNDIGW